jgi:hypothetical protein
MLSLHQFHILLEQFNQYTVTYSQSEYVSEAFHSSYFPFPSEPSSMFRAQHINTLAEEHFYYA